MRIARLAILPILWVCLALPAKAQTISWIDWADDAVVDGSSSGQIVNRNTAAPATITVAATSAPLTNNGGRTILAVPWSGFPSVNGVPGINTSVNSSYVVLTGTAAAPATNTFRFTSAGAPYALLNPILLFGWVDSGVEILNFPDVPNVAGAITVIDHNLTTAPTIAGNTVTVSGGANADRSGFAIQLKGAYSTVRYTAAMQNAASAADSDIITIIQPNYAVLKISRTWQVIDRTGLGAKAVPGNDMQFNVELTNEGGASADADTAFVVQTLPTNWAFFTGDADGAGAGTGPVQLTVLNGANVTLTQSATTGVAYSSSATAPTSFAQCSYTPTGTYDANVRHICISLKGSFASANPFPIARLLYLARIN